MKIALNEDGVLVVAQPKPKFLMSNPKGCQLCQALLADMDKIYDFSISTYGGQWGWGCTACFAKHAGRLGIGRGQEFSRQQDGKFLLTGGGT